VELKRAMPAYPSCVHQGLSGLLHADCAGDVREVRMVRSIRHRPQATMITSFLNRTKTFVFDNQGQAARKREPRRTEPRTLSWPKK